MYTAHFNKRNSRGVTSMLCAYKIKITFMQKGSQSLLESLQKSAIQVKKSVVIYWQQGPNPEKMELEYFARNWTGIVQYKWPGYR